MSDVLPVGPPVQPQIFVLRGQKVGHGGCEHELNLTANVRSGLPAPSVLKLDL